MKRMWMVGVLALVVAAVAAPPASAGGGNSDNAKLCQKGGWKTLYRGDGSTFANQGACVTYGAHGNAILTEPPEPPNAWKAACEQAGGTFSVSNTDAVGEPFTPPAYAYKCTPVSFETWDDALTTICSTYPDWVISRYLYILETADCVRAGTV